MDSSLEKLTAKGDFFGIIRLIESRHTDLPRLGQASTPAKEPLRFSQPANLAFAPRTVEPLKRQGGHLRLAVNFLGLLGPNGPLPAHLTEFVRDRQRNSHDPTLAGFLDIFHQRMLALFYRAWALNHKATDLDRANEARFSSFFGSFFGESDRSRQDHDSLPHNAKLYYSGQLARQTRSSEGLEAILADFFQLPVTVQTLIGQWLQIPRECRTQLGGEPMNSILGQTAIAGETVWDVQSRFRVHIGPVDLDRFFDFLPGARSAARLIDWIRQYTMGEFQWDLRLTLKAEQVPGTSLTGMTQLGWTSWLLSEPAQRNADDLTLILQPTFHTTS